MRCARIRPPTSFSICDFEMTFAEYTARRDAMLDQAIVRAAIH
jgi:hypothetical protein